MSENKGRFFEWIQALIEWVNQFLNPKKPVPIRVRIDDRRR